MQEKCPTCFGTGRRPDIERSVCMFCGRTTADEVRYIFATDGPLGLVAICNLCITAASDLMKAEDAKNIKFDPRGKDAPPDTDPRSG